DPFVAIAAALFRRSFAHPFKAHPLLLFRRRVQFRWIAAILAAEIALGDHRTGIQRKQHERRGDSRAPCECRSRRRRQIGTTPLQGSLLTVPTRAGIMSEAREKPKTRGQYSCTSVAWFRSPHAGLAARMMRTSE